MLLFTIAIFLLGVTAQSVQAQSPDRVVPVIIAYTPAAQVYWATDPYCQSQPCDINRLLDRALSDLDQFAARSGLNFRVREERRLSVELTENLGGLLTQCNNLADTPPAALAASIASARKLLIVIGNFGYTGGSTCRLLSATSTGVSVLHTSELARGPAQGFRYEIPSATMAHELAHQLGAGHQAGSAMAGTPPAQAYYLDLNGDGMTGFKTIVVSAETTQLRSLPNCFCFSNPQKSYTVNGVAYPTGTDSANNAARMMKTVDGLTVQPPTNLQILVR